MRILPLLATGLFMFAPVGSSVYGAEVATVAPDVIALKVISALRKNDLAQAVAELPVGTREEMTSQWEKRKADLKSGALKEETAETEAFLQRMQSPNAVDELMKEYSPAIQDQTSTLTGMRMVGTMAPQMLAEAGKKEPIIKGWGTLLQGLTFDAASWMEVS